MNESNIYDFVTSLLFGYLMDQTLFQTYLDSSQQEVEGVRPWVILRAKDSSQTCGPSTTWQTPFNLGSVTYPFKKFFGSLPIVLTDANNNPFVLKEVAFASRFTYQNQTGAFCVDYVNKQIYIMGTLTQVYTINQTYIYRPPRLLADDSNIWVFESYDPDYSKILGVLVALKWKGVDYDIINLQNAGQLGQMAAAILGTMTSWDTDIQVNMQAGYDPFGTGTLDWQAGRLPSGLGPS